MGRYCLAVLSPAQLSSLVSSAQLFFRGLVSPSFSFMLSSQSFFNLKRFLCAATLQRPCQSLIFLRSQSFFNLNFSLLKEHLLLLKVAILSELHTQTNWVSPGRKIRESQDAQEHNSCGMRAPHGRRGHGHAVRFTLAGTVVSICVKACIGRVWWVGCEICACTPIHID